MENTQLGQFMAIGMAFFAFFALFLVFMIVCQWIIFSKARQPGWASIIPVYNLVILLKIVGRPVSWILWFLQLFFFEILFISAPGAITGLLLFLSGVTLLVFSIIITNGLSKSFGKDAGFTVGLIFLGFIFYPILAFGKATYVGPGGVPPSSDSAQV